MSVKAVNICGASATTQPLVLVAGSCPDAPTLVTTQVQADQTLTCSWTEGAANGFSIIGHQVSIATNNGVYTNVAQYCQENSVRVQNGEQNIQNVVGNTCTIPQSYLRSGVFNLAEQAAVSCQVITVNTRCSSSAVVGGGAFMPILARVPDAPTIQFVSRQCGQVTVQCNPGINNNGAEVTSYQVSYFESGLTNALTSSVNISPGINANTNQGWLNRQATITDAVNGKAYTFYCRSYNRVGYSAASAYIDINVGDVPGRPTAVVTTLNPARSHTIVSWAYPTNTCGWPITGCTVAIQKTENRIVNGLNQEFFTYNDATFNCAETVPLANNVVNNNV